MSLLLSLLLASPTPVWALTGDSATFSSPRLADLDGNGVPLVVVGHGLEGVHLTRTLVNGGSGSLTAHELKTGALRWRFESDRELFGTPTFVDLNRDGRLDVVIGGRDAALAAVNGINGEVLWRWRLPRKGPGRFNFYTAQPLPDQDGDGVQDLLCANGGDVTKGPGEARESGHLMVLSGRTAKVLAVMPMPDGAETYMSPLVWGDRVVFGSGGETHAGGLWAIHFETLMGRRKGAAVPLVRPREKKGIIAPPALGDLDGDGRDDVVASLFDGRLAAVSAKDEALWTVDQPGHEAYASPALGKRDADAHPDVVAAFNRGTWPRYDASTLVVVSGGTGKVLARHALPGFVYASPLLVDDDGDGVDEIYVVATKGNGSTLYRIDEKPEKLFPLEGLMPSTPYLGDPDGDGVLDLIAAYTQMPKGASMESVPALAGKVRSTVLRLKLNQPAPGKVSWGGYLGTRGDGRLRR